MSMTILWKKVSEFGSTYGSWSTFNNWIDGILFEVNICNGNVEVHLESRKDEAPSVTHSFTL